MKIEGDPLNTQHAKRISDEGRLFYCFPGLDVQRDCGAALKRRYLMVPASAQLGVRPERKDGVHPALCNAPPP